MRDMNKQQRLVLMIGAIAVLAVTLFPPWIYQLNDEGYGISKLSGGHGFVFSPPSRKDAAEDIVGSALVGRSMRGAEGSLPYAVRTSVWLDGPRLAGEIAGFVLTTAGLVLAFWRRAGTA
jgi:hypothetical protein